MKIKLVKTFLYCIALAGVLVLTSCISTRYHGKSYAPTKEIAIFYSRSDLPKGEYQTMGELEVIADTPCSSDAIIKKIREESMAKGADIAIIGWFDSRFITPEHKHSKSCSSSHCHHDAKDQYKHKKLVKVILLKIKTTK